MNSQIQVSAKSLGQLALPDFCERCFWLRLRCRDKFPFVIFPGIFSSIDAYSKKVTASHFAKFGKAPHWFHALGEVGAPVAVPHWSRFNLTDREKGVTLTGMPDEILRLRDGALAVADYKTARFTPTADTLLPLYRVQLNAYAAIAPQVGMGHVSTLALFYYEPVTEVTTHEVDSLVEDNGFSMRFSTKVLRIPLDVALIPPLLARVRKIHDSPCAPAAKEGCGNCTRLDAMIEMAMR